MSEENYPLDDLTIALVSDYQRQVQIILAKIEGSLTLFTKQHDLTGPWTLAPNGRELQRLTSDNQLSGKLVQD